MTIADTVRHHNGPLTIRARWVLPIHLPPIQNGEVVIADGRIVSVGKANGPLRPDVLDLGLVALLPGLVNAHTHLEYTVMRGLLEEMDFFPWIRDLTALKAFIDLDDWVASATLGAAEMLAGGVTTLGDGSDTGAALHALLSSGLRGTVYREVFGTMPDERDDEKLATLKTRVGNMRAQIARAGADDRVRVGVAPHAPYTVRPSLLSVIAEYAYRENLPQMIHLAESRPENDLLQHQTGAFAEFLERRGATWSHPPQSAVRYAKEAGTFAATTQAVHCVDIDDQDIADLVTAQATVAHCPKSNGKLGAGFAPVAALRRAGVPVGLGTDSVASNNGADMFEEMRTALFFARASARSATALSARDVLSMATIEGARSLHFDQDIGTLERGKRADLCAVRLDGLHLVPVADDDPVAALVYGARASDVLVTMVNGRVLHEQGAFTLLDVSRLRTAVGQIRARLRAHIGPDGRVLPTTPTERAKG